MFAAVLWLSQFHKNLVKSDRLPTVFGVTKNPKQTSWTNAPQEYPHGTVQGGEWLFSYSYVLHGHHPIHGAPKSTSQKQCELHPKWLQGCINQWLFLVPLKGGRDYIIPQLAVYTTYILPSGGLYNPYHLLGEPETAIESTPPPSVNQNPPLPSKSWR